MESLGSVPMFEVAPTVYELRHAPTVSASPDPTPSSGHRWISAMGHHFDAQMRCLCGRTWQQQQDQPTPCSWVSRRTRTGCLILSQEEREALIAEKIREVHCAHGHRWSATARFSPALGRVYCCECRRERTGRRRAGASLSLEGAGGGQSWR